MERGILVAPMTAMRTNRPDARATIAHAASPRSCSKIFAAVQLASWRRPFNSTNYGEFKTDPSLLQRLHVKAQNLPQENLW